MSRIFASINYLLVPVAAILVLVVIWTLPFEMMERLYGMLGLTMLVFVEGKGGALRLDRDPARHLGEAHDPGDRYPGDPGEP